jgi:hypothetical protein
VKKFLATLLIACLTLTVSIGCSGDTTKDKKPDTSKKDEPAKTDPAKKP